MRLARAALAQYYIDPHLIDTANSLADGLPQSHYIRGNERRTCGGVHLQFIRILASCHYGHR